MSSEVQNTLRELKRKILALESSSLAVSETDTRQGFINPLFHSLGWDFGDFNSVKSELRSKKFNKPADYGFFSSKDKKNPILLLEAKSFGKNMNDSKNIQQLCNYLGELGVQWGVLSDGNRYIMYNSNSGGSYDSWKFLSLSIKDMDTDDGLPCEELAEKFIALLSRKCLENSDIQKTYEEHMINDQLENAMMSLLSDPFDTLAKAIKKEFSEKRVNVNKDLRIPLNRIVSYLKDIADEEGKIPLDLCTEVVEDDSDILNTAIEANKNGQNASKIIKEKRRKRISISDLIKTELIKEGDVWKLDFRGEIFWGRITGNGEIEINGAFYSNPSRASAKLINRTRNGWVYWTYRDEAYKWIPIEKLKEVYKKKYRLEKSYKKKAS